MNRTSVYGVLRETRGYGSHKEVRVPTHDDGSLGYENLRNASRAADRMNKSGQFDNAEPVLIDLRRREGD